MKRIFMSLVFVVLLLTGCNQTKVNEEPQEFIDVPQDFKADYLVTMELEDGEIIKIELYKEVAPITVINFVKLVNEGFYDGLTFHRVIENFMIQGGDPQGTGTGGPGHIIKGEFTKNGVKNYLKHTRGVISMARSKNPNSAGSQFFIMHQDAPHLNGDYAAFGKVIEGMDVVDKIAKVPTNRDDKPLTKVVMKKLTVKTIE